MMNIMRLFPVLLLISPLFGTPPSTSYPDEPDAAVRFVANQLAAMNGEVLWDALPESYQADITNLAKRSSEKIDAENYGRTFVLLARIAGLIENKSDFICHTKLGGGLPEESLPEIKRALPLLSTLLRDFSTGAISTHAGLQDFDGRVFFEEFTTGLLRFIEASANLDAASTFSISDLASLEVKVVEQDVNTASLETVLPGSAPEREDYVRVEDRWLPLPFAEMWGAEISKANSSLQAVTAEQVNANKVQAGMILGILEGVMSQIEGADSQESFDRALQGAVIPIMGMLMMGGDSGLGSGNPAAQDAVTAP